MSGPTILFLCIFMSYILVAFYLSVYQVIDKIKAIKTGKYVEYWSGGDRVVLFTASPFTIFFIILYELNKVRNIIISKLANLLINFDASKIKNIF